MSHGYPRKAEHTAALLAWKAQVNLAWNMGQSALLLVEKVDERKTTAYITIATANLKAKLDAFKHEERTK